MVKEEARAGLAGAVDLVDVVPIKVGEHLRLLAPRLHLPGLVKWQAVVAVRGAGVVDAAKASAPKLHHAASGRRLRDAPEDNRANFATPERNEKAAWVTSSQERFTRFTQPGRGRVAQHVALSRTRTCSQGGKRSRKRPYRRPFVLITFPPGRLVIDYNSRQGDFHLIKPGQNPAWL